MASVALLSQEGVQKERLLMSALVLYSSIRLLYFLALSLRFSYFIIIAARYVIYILLRFGSFSTFTLLITLALAIVVSGAFVQWKCNGTVGALNRIVSNLFSFPFSKLLQLL